MPDAQLLNTVVQGGSFAVLVLIIVWFGIRVIPSAMAAHQTTIRDLMDNFRQEMRVKDERYDAAARLQEERIRQQEHRVDRLADAMEQLACDFHERHVLHPPALPAGPTKPGRNAL
jgi:Sec-independent protein translocase protein TatA